MLKLWNYVEGLHDKRIELKETLKTQVGNKTCVLQITDAKQDKKV